MRIAFLLASCILFPALALGADLATFSGQFGNGAIDPVRGRLYINVLFGPLKVIDNNNTMSDFPVQGNLLAFEPLLDKLVLQSTAGSAHLLFVDPDTLATRSVDVVGGPPAAVLADAATRRWYVLTRQNSGASTVNVIDADTLGMQSVPVGANASEMVLNEVTNKVYVSGSTMYAIDGATAGAAALPFAGFALSVNPATNKIYSGDAQIDGTSHAVTSFTFPAGAAGGPKDTAVDPLTGNVYVSTDRRLFDFDSGSASLAQLYESSTSGVGGGVIVDVAAGKAYVKFFGTFNFPGDGAVVDEPTGTVVGHQGSGGASNGAFGYLINPVNSRTYSWGAFEGLCAGPLGPNCGSLVISDRDPGTPQSVPPFTTIQPLVGNTVASSTPRFTFTTSNGLDGQPARALFFQIDGTSGRWLRATNDGTNRFTARSGPLAPGSHTLHAFAADRGIGASGGTLRIGSMVSYTFTVLDGCSTVACSDLTLTRTTVPAVGFTGKDALYRIRVTNNGAAPASNVLLTEELSLGVQFVWASPGCTPGTGGVVPPPGGGAGGLTTVVQCMFAGLAAGASAEVTVVMRPGSGGTKTNTAFVDADQLDPQTDDNASTVSISVTDPPPANLVPRYRLYSPVSLEHHYTMDANEYAVLGASGAWVQEGQVGSVLDNPGSFNGVQAVPYYRLYNTFTRWHHWTTDPNEYYTLITFPGWGGEDVAGYIFLTQAPGTTQLYRLTYPFIGGLHHWTIDANEYNTLISQYGWVGEGGSGFVIQ